MYEIKDNIISIELDDDFVEYREQKEEEEDNKIVQKVLEEVLPQIPTPKDGEDGKDGKTPTKTEIKQIVKEVLPEEKIIEKVLKKIPKPKDGEKGDKGEDGKSFRFSDLTPYEKQILTGPQGSNGVGVPRYGTTGQKLVKASSKDFDTEWVDDSGGSTWGSITGTLSDQTDLQTSLDSKIDGTLTATRIPFASDSNTLTDKNGFDYISATNTLNSFLTETERVTNPNFTGNASGWTVNTGWGYNSNAVYHSSNGTGILSQTPTIYNGGYYKLTIVALNPQSGSWVGTITVTCGGVSVATISSAGTYTYYVLATNNSGLTLTPSNTGRFGVDSCSLLELTAGNIRSGNLYANELVVAGNKSNSGPGTTRHISLKNYGSNTWIDTYFGNTAGPVLGFDSGGNMQYRATGGGQHVFHNAGQASLYIASVGTLVYGYLGTQGGVNVGSTSSSPKT